MSRSSSLSPGRRVSRAFIVGYHDLPPGVTYHLIFGHPDSVVPLESALMLAEYEEATVRRFPLDHVEILHSPELSDYVNELLSRAED